MLAITRRLRHPESSVKRSAWLPAGLRMYEEGQEGLDGKGVMEWLVSKEVQSDYAFWTKYTWVDRKLRDTHEKLMLYTRRSGKLARGKEAEKAVSAKRMSSKDGQKLVREVNELARDPLFQQDWQYLQERYRECFWRGRFYPQVPTRKRIRSWRELNELAVDDWDEANRLREDVTEFLNCYAIDAVCGGVPFVDVFDVACRWYFDRLGRPVVQMAASAYLPAEKLRRVVEAARAKFTEVERFIDKGRPRGSGLEISDRNKQIYAEFKKLRGKGMRVEDACDELGPRYGVSGERVRKIVQEVRRWEAAEEEGRSCV